MVSCQRSDLTSRVQHRRLTSCFEGPLREGDRVPYPYFAVKDFVFDKGPGEYAFDVPEKLKDRIQIIDITDDVTGERKYDECVA